MTTSQPADSAEAAAADLAAADRVAADRVAAQPPLAAEPPRGEGALERLGTELALAASGLVAGALTTMLHRARIDLGFGPVWLGVVAAIACLGLLAVGLRLYLRERGPASAFAFGATVAIVALMGWGPILQALVTLGVLLAGARLALAGRGPGLDLRRGLMLAGAAVVALLAGWGAAAFAAWAAIGRSIVVYGDAVGTIWALGASAVLWLAASWPSMARPAEAGEAAAADHAAPRSSAPLSSAPPASPAPTSAPPTSTRPTSPAAGAAVPPGRGEYAGGHAIDPEEPQP